MADLTLTTDLILTMAVVLVAAIAIIMFVRASGGGKKKEEAPTESPKEEDPVKIELQLAEKRVKVPSPEKKLASTDVDHARSEIRTLTLKQEIVSMVLRRLFEAEDEGEITREERVHLSKTYEDEMKEVNEALKRSELVVSLAELESIREDIIKKFEDTLSQTQTRIDAIIKELKIEEPKKAEEEPKPKIAVPPKRRRVVTKAKPDEEGEEAGEEGEEQPEEGEKAPSGKGDVESRLEQLKKEVMKELDELDKLELEA